jgi:hypothetical protein
MSGFKADWLQRREPFDAAARDRDLARRFGAVLGDGRNKPLRIVDLAAGTGASFRALAPLMGGDQDWLLVDHDPLLIAAQAAEIARWSTRNGWHCEAYSGGVLVRAGNTHWRARSLTLDLAHFLERVDFAECDGVTTAAFLDLVSTAWLERLCGVLTRSSLPLLATLTVDGRREWHPSLPADARVHEAFRRHQSGDKGFGPAQGGLATTYLADRLAEQGYKVTIVHSDWRIGAEDREMLVQMVEETTAVALQMEPTAAALDAGWSAQRHAQIRSGLLSLQVGHLDMLAIPAHRSPS